MSLYTLKQESEDKKMGRTIRIFDTTLRDGEQSPGCSMNLNEKIEVAKQLEMLSLIHIWKRRAAGV